MDPATNDPLKAAMQALRPPRAPFNTAFAPVPLAAPPPPGPSTAPPPLSPAKPAAARTRTGKKTAAPVKPPPTKPAAGSAPALPSNPPAPPPGDASGRGFSASGKKLGRPKKVLVPEIVSDMSELNEEIKDLNVKDHLTEKEMLFIEIFLAGGCSREEAMISSGYGNYSKSHQLGLSRKIINKYESLAGEHRKTFRAVGAGEVAVAQGLLKLAESAKSEMVKMNAWIAIGKILGLTQDVVAINQGISIVIKGREDHTGRPAAQGRLEAPKAIPKAIAILK